MKRDYYRWFSPALGRDMEMLVYGHEGLPAIVFPTSCGHFFDFEDHGMVATVEHKLDFGQLQTNGSPASCATSASPSASTSGAGTLATTGLGSEMLKVYA